MASSILRDPEATTKLLEAIYDSPSGKRSLSRLARTCRGFSEPALNILWRDLDSIVPIIGLFPGQLLKKARKPGLGLSRLPRDEDWKTIIRYSGRIRRITYDEAANNLTPSIFSVLDECRPRSMTWILPQLQELTWKVETAAALERCMIFLHPTLQVVNLEVGTKFPQLNTFLADMSSRTNLKGFSFISPTSLPDAFTDILRRHEGLEKVALVAPGALGSGIGRWLASLKHLKHLQVDLTGRSPIAVEGFFDELRPRSGDSTPSSIGSRDSGIFSGEELDFTEIRKSALRLTGDLPSKGSFAQLKKVHLTGEAANIDVFLKHLDSDLTHLDLVIEDPPDNADWQDLSALLCERFGYSLQSIRITPTASARYADLVRQTARGEPPAGRLSLEQFVNLPHLNRFEVDLPESVVFTPVDIECIAKACPKLEILRLCPLARFPAPHVPKLTLESLIPLVVRCRRLHTLAVVVNALPGSQDTLSSSALSSPSLLRLHVGHSWSSDPLQIAILLSHLMPRLEALKWFQEKTRTGFTEAHAKCWQSISETLPHLQFIRATEKTFTRMIFIEPVKPETSEKGVDATVVTRNRGVNAVVQTSESSIQSTPRTVSCGIDAHPRMVSTGVDASPSFHEMSIETEPVIISLPPSDKHTNGHAQVTFPMLRSIQNIYFISSILNLLSFAYRFATFPVSFVARTSLLRFPLKRRNPGLPMERQKKNSSKHASVGVDASESADSISLDSFSDVRL